MSALCETALCEELDEVVSAGLCDVALGDAAIYLVALADTEHGSVTLADSELY